MSFVFFLLSLAIGAVIFTALIAWILWVTGYAQRLAIDVPNHRSLHTHATPRIGGWAVMPVVIGGMLIWVPSLWPLALITLLVALISYLDDWRGLSISIRFIVHALAVLSLLLFYAAPLSKWHWIATAFVLVGCMNAYNFMDGADGLAGGMTVLGFGAYAIAAALRAPDLAISAALIAGAAGGFLIFNWPPARLFLGDSGSIPIGFLAAALGYTGIMRGIWPITFPLIVFAPFILDTAVTLFRRLLRGEKCWQAHREHYYQRMIQMSGEHAATVRIWYAAIALSTGLALAGLRMSGPLQWIVLALWISSLLMYGWRIDCRWRAWRRHSASADHSDTT